MFWLIPARAGNIEKTPAPSRHTSAHPRSRGEHLGGLWSDKMPRGSSPLARGTSPTQKRTGKNIRLIPARAGNMRQPRPQPTSRAAHPRSRGEHLYSTSHLALASGSSPLARGTFLAVPGALRRIRLIPARAGNIPCPSRQMRARSAHPRSRGEHCLLLAGDVLVAGSSPLARGTFPARRATGWEHRLIPARAGNIHVGTVAGVLCAAHPRSRGEHVSSHRMMVYGLGSSPLARGTFGIFYPPLC